jgi:hypothetical protein
MTDNAPGAHFEQEVRSPWPFARKKRPDREDPAKVWKRLQEG